jgi:hypothetical protein
MRGFRRDAPKPEAKHCRVPDATMADTYPVLINCPETGHAVDTGFSMRQDMFAAASLASLVKCPHCKRKHPWDMKDAWLDQD